MFAYEDLHKTGLKATLISLEMELGQNNCFYMEKGVAKKLLSLPFFICKQKLNAWIYPKVDVILKF